MPTNEYGQPTDSKGNVLTQSQVIEAELDVLIKEAKAISKVEIDDALDRKMLYEKKLIEYIAPYVLKHRHDVYFQAFKDGLVAGRKEAQAMLDSSEEE